jgi:hypothetical protein
MKKKESREYIEKSIAQKEKTVARYASEFMFPVEFVQM